MEFLSEIPVGGDIGAMGMSDEDLFDRYRRDGSEAAFTELVARHVNLVYSVARRQVRSTQLAEEVAQSVFIDLARHARKIESGTPLVAWLHLVSRRTAIDVVRREARRHTREHQAAELAVMNPTPSVWAEVEPLLDEAVESLPAADRTAILLRYFESKTLREIGESLGTTEDAAQKRVSRAVDQLRAFFLRRGVTVTAAGLATDLSAHALQIAPAGLGPAIAGTAAVGGAISVTAAETSRFIVMTTLQKSVAVTAFVMAAGAGLYQANLVAQQSSEMTDLREENDRTAREIHGLRLTHAAAVARLKNVEQRIDARLAATLPGAPADATLESQMQQWLAQVDRIREFLTQRPEWDIPELKLLSERDWFNAAGGERLQSEEQFRRTTSRLRDLAVSLASDKFSKALSAYVRAHDGVLPNTPLDLVPSFATPLAPEILARYEMLRTGPISDVPPNELIRLLAPKAPADVEFDSNHYIGTTGYGNNGAAISTAVREARQKFSQANNGQRATTAEQLLPYVKWPVSLAALQRFLNPQPTPDKP